MDRLQKYSLLIITLLGIMCMYLMHENISLKEQDDQSPQEIHPGIVYVPTNKSPVYCPDTVVCTLFVATNPVLSGQIDTCNGIGQIKIIRRLETPCIIYYEIDPNYVYESWDNAIMQVDSIGHWQYWHESQSIIEYNELKTENKWRSQ